MTHPTQDKFMQIVDKYTKKFDLTKDDFGNFVRSRVELPKKKCDKFLKIIE